MPSRWVGGWVGAVCTGCLAQHGTQHTQTRTHTWPPTCPAPAPGCVSELQLYCTCAAHVLQTEMRKLEQVVHSIHIELQNIRRKEEKMRNVNGGWEVVGWGDVRGGRQ